VQSKLSVPVGGSLMRTNEAFWPTLKPSCWEASLDDYQTANTAHNVTSKCAGDGRKLMVLLR